MKSHRAFVFEEGSVDDYVKLILTHFLGDLTSKGKLKSNLRTSTGGTEGQFKRHFPQSELSAFPSNSYTRKIMYIFSGQLMKLDYFKSYRYA
jgi:hypothetical protein